MRIGRKTVIAFTALVLASASTTVAETLSCAVPADIQAKVQLFSRVDKADRFLRAKEVFASGMQALPALIRLVPETIPRNASIAALSDEKQDAVRQLVGLMRSLIQEHGARAIRLFRECDDDPATIKPLIWLARGDDREARISAANILANVIDNSNICFVLHHLRDSRISKEGRVNLLAVTNSMASYAYKPNAKNIGEVLDSLKVNLSGQPDMEQTLGLAKIEIVGRIKGSANQDADLPPSLGRHCATYDYFKPLD